MDRTVLMPAVRVTVLGSVNGSLYLLCPEALEWSGPALREVCKGDSVTGGPWWLYQGGYKWMTLKEVGIRVFGVRRCSSCVWGLWQRHRKRRREGTWC